jgi:hypothetical protein
MYKHFLLPALGLISLVGCLNPRVEKKNPTYHKDVEPIINEFCVNCHQEGGIGPFTFLSYADAFDKGAEMFVQTESRLMPPWHIQDDGNCQTFRDSRSLTDDQIDTIRVWFDNGMPEGDPADAPPPPPPPKAIDRIDAKLDMNIDYLPDEGLTDDYRCFLVDPGLVTDRFMTAYEVLPGTSAIVHHIILFTINSDEAQVEAEGLENADGRPGYTCFGDARVDATPIFAWAPGINLQELPPSTGVRLPAGRKLAMQIHYNTQAIKPGQELPTDRTVVNLKLEDAVPLEAFVAILGDFDFVLQPGLTAALAEETLPLAELPLSFRLQGVLPHMHTRGQTLNFELIHENGDTECLANVPDWDFNWQQTYFYKDPVTIKPTDSVRIRCSYDTTDETTPIVFGESTSDEMCLTVNYLTF